MSNRWIETRTKVYKEILEINIKNIDKMEDFIKRLTPAMHSGDARRIREVDAEIKAVKLWNKILEKEIIKYKNKMKIS